ncbi:MAG TPA: hypothetical protein DCE71_02055 [Parachlamydiales bacterium]|nr:hypothetical protein [Parachlamydiales bacterium]
MKPKKRQKLCYHCEGEIDLDVIVCPFCAADLREEKPEQIKSIYRSFGGVERTDNHETSQSLYPSPFPTKSEPVLEEVLEEESVAHFEKNPSSDKLSSVICPTILFTLGIQLFVLGMFILLFSHKGIVLLKWDGTLWFLYVLAACPLLYFGYRALSKIDR